MSFTRTVAVSLMAVFLLISGNGASYAAYPDRPITLIIPFGAGGGTDIPARMLAGFMEKKLGQPIVAQNVVGGVGTQGVAQLLATAPDGYTLGYIPVGVLATQPHLVKVPYDRDAFDFIGLAANQSQVLLTPNEAPWNTLEELVAEIKKNPDKYKAGVTGIGNLTHLPLVAFTEHYGLKVQLIPFRSSPDIMKEILASRVHLYFCEPLLAKQFNVKPYCQTSHEALSGFDVPAFKDLGIKQSFSVWQGVVAPKGLPKDVHAKLTAAMREVVTDSTFQAELKRIDMAPEWREPEAFKALYNKDYDAYGEMLRTSGISKP